MSRDYSAKRKDVLGFLVVVLLVAFFINMCSNVVFAAYYTNSPVLVTAISIAGLAVTSILAYILTVSSTENASIKVTIPAVFDRVNNKFIDVPFSAFSVNCRVYYDRLTDEERASIRDQFLPLPFEKVWDSELRQFLEQAAQTFLLSYILTYTQRPVADERLLEAEALPEILLRNRAIQEDIKKHRPKGYVLPSWITIEGYPIVKRGDRDWRPIQGNPPLLKFTSKYGSVTFKVGSWVLPSGLQSTRDIFALTVRRDEHEFAEAAVTVQMETKNNFWYLFSATFSRHLGWCELVEEKVQKLDWNLYQDQITHELLARLVAQKDDI